MDLKLDFPLNMVVLEVHGLRTFLELPILFELLALFELLPSTGQLTLFGLVSWLKPYTHLKVPAFFRLLALLDTFTRFLLLSLLELLPRLKLLSLLDVLSLRSCLRSNRRSLSSSYSEPYQVGLGVELCCFRSSCLPFYCPAFLEVA
jgi:hypothetical protein